MKLLRSIIKSNNGRTVANNYLALLFIQAANILLPLAIIPYLVRTLGTEKYGIILIAQSFCTMVYVFVEFGFTLSATRRISLARDNKKEKEQIFSAVLAIQGILLTVVFIVYMLIVTLYSQFRLEWEVYILSFGVVVGQALFPTWFFQGIEKMRLIAVINVVAKIIFTVLIFIFIQELSDYYLVPLFNSTGYIFAGIVSIIVSLQYTRFKRPSKTLMRELVIESKSLFVSNIAARLFNSANIFIVGIIAGDATAGIYGSFEKIFIASKSFFSPIFQAVFPWLSKQSFKNQRSNMFKMAPVLFLCAAFFTIIVMFFGEEILNLLFNDAKITAYTQAFKILSVATIFAALNMGLLSLFFPATGSYQTRMIILLIGGIFNVTTAIFLVSLYGIYGIVVSIVLTELLLFICSVIYFMRMKKGNVYA